jgi:hypothetical protein
VAGVTPERIGIFRHAVMVVRPSRSRHLGLAAKMTRCGGFFA